MTIPVRKSEARVLTKLGMTVLQRTWELQLRSCLYIVYQNSFSLEVPY